MAEHGGAKHHRERLGEALRDEISTIIEGELADPRIGLASVTEVHLAQDGRSARVFVNVEGEDEDVVQTIQGLDAAKQYIRRELTDRLRLRQAPELHFNVDRGTEHSARVEELLGRMKKRKK